KDVTIAYRRTVEQAPANEEEIEEAKEEGIDFKFLASPSKVCGDEEKGIEKVTCSCMELGEPDESGRPKPVEIPDEYVDIEADSVILAIGQQPDLELLEKEGLDKDKYTLGMNSKFQTNFEDVFTAGDAVLGPSSMVECTGQAREAVYALDAYLKGELDSYEVPEDYTMPYGYVHEDEITEEDLLDYTDKPRVSMPMRDPEERIQDFEPIELGWTDEEAQKEAERCLECGCLDRFECKLREYADMYDAEQYTYEGFTYEYEVDDSHPNVVREPNKCILCGSCVRTTEEVHDEGTVQFANRGLKTVVEPAFGDPLGEVDSKLVGDLADACPTGALEEVLQDKKPGPHETEIAGNSYCVGCGLTCPVEVRTVNGRPVMLKPEEDTVYQGHLCDIGKFDTIVKPVDKPRLDENWMDDFEKTIGKKRTDVLISSDTTLEEAEKLIELADKLGGNAVIEEVHTSTAGLDELLSADTVFVENGVYDVTPILKMFVKRAKENGAKEVLTPENIGEGVAVVTEKSDITADRMLVATTGANSKGLSQMELKHDFSDADNVIVYSDNLVTIPENKTVIQFTPRINDLSDSAELVVPIRSWLEKEGTIMNTFGKKIELKEVISSKLPKNTEVLDKILNKL
ncbi:MAG: FAD-dependent oxidoreductase, partial [Thermoplasmata archaeon]